MVNVVLPDSRIERPEHYHPRRKPTGRVVVSRRHWFGKTLGAYWLPQGQTGNARLRDLVGGIHMNPTFDFTGGYPLGQPLSTKLSVGMVVSANGDVSAGNPGDAAYYIHSATNDPFRQKERFCVMAMFTVGSVQSSVDPRVISKDNGGNESDHDFMIGWTRTGQWRTRLKINGANTLTIVTDINQVIPGDTVLLVGGADGSNGRLKVVYPDGLIKQGTTAPSSNGLTVTASKPIAIFRNAGFTGNWAHGHFHWGACCNTWFSDNLLRRIARESYRHLIPG